MYLSLLPVDYRNDIDSPGYAWLQNLYSVHQRLWMAFPDQTQLEQDPFFLGPWHQANNYKHNLTRDKEGFLFRIERDGTPRILVQSVQKPNWNYAFQNAPWLLSGLCKVRTFEPSCVEGAQYRFRLLSNVVERVSVITKKQKTTSRGVEVYKKKRIERLIPKNVMEPLPSNSYQRQQVLAERERLWWEWLGKQGKKNGFYLEDCISIDAPFIKIYKINPHNWNMRFNAVQFEGILKCVDHSLMNRAITYGVGRSKAFGFGLLSLAKVSKLSQ